MNAKVMTPQNTIKQIIKKSTYLSLGTTDGLHPWVNAVFFASDKEYNLYFVSYNNSVHVQNILKNHHVSVAIFDSHIIPDTGKTQGIQIQGTCKRLTKKELQHAIKVVYDKRFPDPKERAIKDLRVENFIKDDSGRVSHIYKITPQKFYIQDQKVGKDTRIEVSMS